MKKTTLKFLSFFLVAAILIYTLSVTAIALEDTTEDTIEKVYCEATLEDEFTDNDILLVMTPENNFREYTVNDFSNIGCVKIEDLSIDPEKGKLCRILHLTLDTHSKQNVLDSIKILEERDDIYSAEPNYISAVQTIPNDTEYVNDEQWYIDKINLLAAWNIETGSDSIRVGIIDSGIDSSHPDLMNRVSIFSKGFSTFSVFPTADLDSDHGTHVAGIIGAQGNNDLGITGICWDVDLVALRVDHIVDGSVCVDFLAVIEAIKYANENYIDILNFSGGTIFETSKIQAVATQIENYDGLFICSAGNNNSNTDQYPYYPSSYSIDNMIVVGSSTVDDNKATHSNYGKTTVDVFAPGENIYSTVFNGGYANHSGTSMASPIVAGVAALLLSLHPELSSAELKAIILSSVDVVYDDNGNNVFGDLCVSGGRINAYKALTNDYVHDYYYTSEGNINKHICTICDYEKIGDHILQYNTIDSSTHKHFCSICDYEETENHTWNYSSINSQQHRVCCQYCSFEYSESHSFNLLTGKCNICNYNMNGMGTLSKKLLLNGVF